MTEFLSAISLALSAIALAVSIKAWHKSRAIYSVERSVIRQYRGTADDKYINESDLNAKLSSGNYTILAIAERKTDNDWEILLGRIKPLQK